MKNFWNKVRKNKKCWIWIGCITKYGYGSFKFKNKPHLAHRVSFYLTFNRWPIPCGLHTCDNRRCVNPEHIFEGTVADNNKDKQNKMTQGKIGKLFGVTHSMISHILRNKTKFEKYL